MGFKWKDKVVVGREEVCRIQEQTLWLEIVTNKLMCSLASEYSATKYKNCIAMRLLSGTDSFLHACRL